MEALLTIRKEAPDRERLLAEARKWLSGAGVRHHTETDRLRIMVAAMAHTTANVSIIVEPKNIEKLAERIREAQRKKDQANAALQNIRDEADVFHGRSQKRARPERIYPPVFLVVAKKKVSADQLPKGVLSFSLEEGDAIVDALREAGAEK